MQEQVAHQVAHQVAPQVTEWVAAAEEQPLSGVVRVDVGGTCVLERAFGFADRGREVPNTPQTRFAIASGSKCFTALAVLSLVAEGRIGLQDPVREVLGADLPQIDADVRIAHLLSHTSGIGEYLDDDADPTAYLMPGSMTSYQTPEDFLGLLDQPMLARPGVGFAYSNAGYVVLGLVAQRVGGQRYQDLVRSRVLGPAGLQDTDFMRTDELPGNAALGYLWPDRPRTNVFHLPVEGSADGGAYTTAADVRAFWLALAAGRIVPAELVAAMTTPAPAHDPDDPYGLGVWLPEPGVWALTGADSGVAFSSEHDPERDLTWTVIANDTDGAWPLARLLTAWTQRTRAVG